MRFVETTLVTVADGGRTVRHCVVRDEAEAEALSQHVLHCGVVRAGDEWDTTAAWPDPDRRALARRLLAAYRRSGRLPTEEERRALATCCV